ncbi:MAG: diaminopimelate decarboxylase [Deltaproteobacteria bacterium]|nr:diaminopimelate decarboxylase [Deltaproteobacteria bacterium]
MHHFSYRRGRLHAEGVSLTQLAREHGTPSYVYSRATLERHYEAMDEALAGQRHLVCYSVKANSNLAVLDVLARKGAGFDVVSGGEILRVRKAGGKASKIVFSGVGKREDELALGLEVGIKVFNVESESELELLARVARRAGKVAPVSLRVNPDVDPKTHPYISTGLRTHKFGIPLEEARRLYARARRMRGIRICGIDCHIGSQLTELSPFVDALEEVKTLVLELRAEGHAIEHIDLGGGLGITYDAEVPPHPREWGRAVGEVLADLPGLEVLVEPGRVIAGNAGILLTRVLHVKQQGERRFVIVDAGMNDLARPALYGAHHSILPVKAPTSDATEVVDVVGPICESGDFLAQNRTLPPVKAGELLAVMSAGAYGFTMSSNYNGRPRAAELLVDGKSVHLARVRETTGDLIRGERRLPR